MPDSPIIDQYGKPIAATEKAAVPPVSFAPDTPGGWFPIIREPFSGAWQRNLERRTDTVLANVTVFRCISLISCDIAKMRARLITEVEDGVWEETESPSFSPVLVKPNHYQNRIQFIENWLTSKLSAGNTYILKERDNRGVGAFQGNVRSLYILDPHRVRPLVANNGDVFYSLYADNLAGLEDQVIVPASEIIHDRWNCLFHPLVGLSPIFANGLTAIQGIRIQEHSERFFTNSANPGGFLTSPDRIPDAVVERLKDTFQERFSGPNAGLIAVLGNGLKYEPAGVTALNSQLIEQLRWTSEMVAASYGVPSYKIGIGPPPTTSNVEALGQQYYEDCLQIHIEAVELCLDEGLTLPKNYGIEFDLSGLFRMDSKTRMEMLAEGTMRGILTPNESRRELNRRKVAGGDTPFMQEQQWPITLLAERPVPSRPPTDPVEPPAQGVPESDAEERRAFIERGKAKLRRFARRYDA